MNIKEEIAKLKKEKNAVILAHYYVDEEVQSVADFIGDSYYLAKVAKSTEADRIIFAGVNFMGESAKLLNEDKRVFMPDATADCPMAHMATAEEIAKLRAEYDDLAVVCYINSTTELKSLSDVIVTSANAVKIVKKLPNKNIFFIPDRNLGTFVKEQVPEKNFIFNSGHCPRHTIISAEALEAAKKAHPSAKIAVHPECLKEITDQADFVGSTSAIIEYVKNEPSGEFIIGTVDGVFYKINEVAPGKKLYRINDVQECPNMKKVTLEKIVDVLENETNEVFLEEAVKAPALAPLERMLELAK